jgi:hypothetical protein
MAPTLVQIAERIGIPRDRFEELIQLPIVARAITVAADKPNLAPGSVWKAVGRPTLWKNPRIDKDAELDVEALEIELAQRLELATRSDGKVVEQRLGYPILQGRLQRATQDATIRFNLIERCLDEIEKDFKSYGTVTPGCVRARDYLKAEVQRVERNATP